MPRDGRRPRPIETPRSAEAVRGPCHVFRDNVTFFVTLLRSTVRGCYGVHPRRTDPAQSAGHDGTDGPDKPCKFRIRVLTFWSFAEGRTVPTHRQRPSNGLKQGTFWRRADRRRSPRVDRHRERRAEQLGTIRSSSSAKTRRAGYQRGRAGSWHKNYDFVRLARKRYALT